MKKTMDEYSVSWEEIGDQIIKDGWEKFVVGKGQTRGVAITKDIEAQDIVERTMFIVYAMAKRLIAMEKTLKKMEKALNKKQETTA
jgi:hypothetical protein